MATKQITLYTTRRTEAGSSLTHKVWVADPRPVRDGVEVDEITVEVPEAWSIGETGDGESEVYDGKQTMALYAALTRDDVVLFYDRDDTGHQTEHRRLSAKVLSRREL